jgi:trk system potassium uptake protein TrkA
MDAAVVAMGEPEPSIMTTLLLKRLDVPYVIAKASSQLHGDILQRVGADRVVFPERETAVRLAHGIEVAEVVDYLSISPDMGISKLPAPHHIVGLTFGETRLEERFGLRLIAIIRSDRVLFGASVGERIQAQDIFLLAGRDKDLHNFSKQDED